MEYFTLEQLLLTIHLCICCLIVGATLINPTFDVFHKSGDVGDHLLRTALYGGIVFIPLINLLGLYLAIDDCRKTKQSELKANSLNELVGLIMDNKDYRFRSSSTLYNEKFDIRITLEGIESEGSVMTINKANKKKLRNILSKEDKYSATLELYKQHKKA